MKFANYTLSLSLVSLLSLASCSKAPVPAEQSKKPPEPVKATPFRGQVYESIDGRNAITLVSPEELESREHGANIICKYTKQDGKLRVIANVLGTTAAIYYRITEEGLQDSDGQILYEPGHLLKVRQIVEMNQALIAAVEAGDANAAEVQLSKGANRKLLCEGKTLLHYAFERSNSPLVKVLLDAGVDPNAFDPSGQPAPIPCNPVPEGSTEILKELIRRGENVNLRDGSGVSAFRNCMYLWVWRGNDTAMSNAIVLFGAGARFSQEDEAAWYSWTHGIPGGESVRPSWDQESLAKPNEATAGLYLGNMYYNGQMVTKSVSEAVKWWRKGADQGNAWAQSNLGAMYATGNGVARDTAEAMRWYRKAAEAGNEGGLNNLAWALATSEDAAVRDGASAVVFAERAVAATKRKNPGYLSTLAAAFAEAGQFEKAVSTQQEAMALPQTDAAKEDCRARLKLFESKVPCRAKD
jgi:tetratricopeptide (TPR) repeat protein